MKTIILSVAAVLLAAVAAVLLVDGDDPGARADGQPAATAPIAPPGVPAARDCVTERPGEGVEAEEDRTVQLGMPAPRTFRPGSPERALAEFMDAWRDRAWDRMALWTAPSWRELTRGDEGRVLRRRYGAYGLRGWTVVADERDPRVTVLRVLVVHRDLEPALQRERLLFVLNREDAGGELVREGGRWGVFVSERPDAANACPSDA